MDRKIDSLGRVTIPKEIRNQVGLRERENFVSLSVENDAIVLRPLNKNVQDWRRITNFKIDTEKIQKIKDKYKPGSRVRLINIENESHLVPRDMLGTVKVVDDLGSIHVKWDNGKEIAVLNIPGDSCELI